jgi:hypothetical protein
LPSQSLGLLAPAEQRLENPSGWYTLPSRRAMAALSLEKSALVLSGAMSCADYQFSKR